MFTVFAHRGASEYAPENTMSSFFLGLKLGANGIETDVRKTKDGVLVLFHDDTLERVTGREGGVGDYTYGELLEMRVKNEKTGTEDIVVSLEDFLKYFGYRDLTFAIELKEKGIERDVLAMLGKYGMREKTVITSFEFDCIKAVKELDPTWRVGYLVSDFNEERLEMVRSIGGEQLCPQAKNVTEEKVKLWHEMGYSVRAWGVTNVKHMRNSYDCGVDGMTVNFPDLLVSYAISKQ